MSERVEPARGPNSDAKSGVSNAGVRVAARADLWSRALVLGACVPTVLVALLIGIHPALRAIAWEGCSLLVDRDVSGLREWALAMNGWAPIATLLLMIVQALAFPLPALIVTFTNGLLLGWFWGGLWSIFSGTVAAVVCFAIGRALGEPVVVRLVSPRGVDTANRFMSKHGVFAILIARLVPIVPFDPISYVAGVTRIRTLSFVIATFVGQIPAGMVYAYFGPRIVEDPSLERVVALVLGVLGIAVFAALVQRLLRRHRQ